MKLFKDRGADALLAKPVPGRPSKLSEDHVRRLYTTLLGKDPRQLGFDFALWTRWMVRELIRRLFEVDLTEQSVGRLLRRLGMSRSARSLEATNRTRAPSGTGRP